MDRLEFTGRQNTLGERRLYRLIRTYYQHGRCNSDPVSILR